MSNADSVDYAALRHLPEGERLAWIAQTYPRGLGIQWWFAMLETAETEARSLLRRGEPAGDALGFAASLLQMGEDTGAIDNVRSSFWRLRFASSAIGLGIHADLLPEALRPDEAARQALSAMPLGPTEAIAAGERIDRELAHGLDRPADQESRAVGDVVLLVESLGQIRDCVTDRELRRQISRWQEAFHDMAPAIDAPDVDI